MRGLSWKAGLLMAGTALVIAGAPSLAALSHSAGAGVAEPLPSPTIGAAQAACMALSTTPPQWPVAGTHLTQIAWHDAGSAPTPSFPGMPPMPPVALPAHCELIGITHERVGADGHIYAIRFHLRLPADWNGKFFMQGGGGTNGDLGDAIGRLGGGGKPALSQGYAVLSQDSGHDNDINTIPSKNGASAFGFDPQARADYGGASLPSVVESAKAAILALYGKAPSRSYFVGCSKGGQEGMMAVQRYPTLFDGVIAGAPGFALPRAAIAEAWDTQAFAQVLKSRGIAVTAQSLAQSFSPTDFKLVGDAILAACDKDDGAADGMVGAFAQCTSQKVLPQLAKVTCAGDKQDGCLSHAQVDALRRVHEGPHDSHGKPLYAGFYWDAGWADMGWRIWKIGGGPMPSINVAMGAPSLAGVFTTPPTVVPDTLAAKMAYAMGFDFDRDAPRIYATGNGFSRSAWEDIGAQSTDLSAFSGRGGKLIVEQGVSDPVFSLADTVRWFEQVNDRNNGNATKFVRLFPVPGMGHCQGGPATDSFDAFSALVDWVEKGQAPNSIKAVAGKMSPWPGRSRPLCPYPKIARYNGSGSIEDADNFSCS